MKRILALLFLIISFSPVFGETEYDDDFIQRDETILPKTRKTSAVRPKREHAKSKIKAEKSLQKNKYQFQKRVEKELELLKEEYDILEYSP